MAFGYNYRSPNETSFGRIAGPNQGIRPNQQGYGQMPSLASIGASWSSPPGHGNIAPWQMVNKPMGFATQGPAMGGYQPPQFDFSGFGQAPQTPSLSSLTPDYQPVGDIFAPRQTQAAVNQIRADADQAANLPWLMKQFASPGISQSAGHAALAMPLAAQALAGGEMGAGQTMLDHRMANAQQGLTDDVQQARLGLGGLDLWRQIDAANKGYGQANDSMLTQLLLG